jgi:hypothetical protein
MFVKSTKASCDGDNVYCSLEYSLESSFFYQKISILIYRKSKQTSDYRVWGTYFKDGKIIKK